jgi:hypothetical protein
VPWPAAIASNPARAVPPVGELKTNREFGDSRIFLASLLWCEVRAEALKFALSPLKLCVHSLCPLGERLNESRLRRNVIWREGPGLAGLIGKLVLRLHPLSLPRLPIVLVADTVPLATKPPNFFYKLLLAVGHLRLPPHSIRRRGQERRAERHRACP